MRLPSSASVPVAEQLRLLPTVTLEDGDIDAVVIVGAVLDTLTLAAVLAEETA